jgi:hypothetical protein
MCSVAMPELASDAELTQNWASPALQVFHLSPLPIEKHDDHQVCPVKTNMTGCIFAYTHSSVRMLIGSATGKEKQNNSYTHMCFTECRMLNRKCTVFSTFDFASNTDLFDSNNVSISLNQCQEPKYVVPLCITTGILLLVCLCLQIFKYICWKKRRKCIESIHANKELNRSKSFRSSETDVQIETGVQIRSNSVRGSSVTSERRRDKLDNQQKFEVPIQVADEVEVPLQVADECYFRVLVDVGECMMMQDEINEVDEL